MARVEPAPGAFAYDSEDLAFFENVVDKLVEELAASDEGMSTLKSREALRRQLGAKLFECARAGERDFLDLRERVLAGLFPGEPEAGV